VADALEKAPSRTDDIDELLAAEVDTGERGCAWLAPYVAVVAFVVYIIFFVFQNSEPIDLVLFPKWDVKVRPPTLVFTSIALGVALTVVVSWLRSRARRQTGGSRRGGWTDAS